MPIVEVYIHESERIALEKLGDLKGRNLGGMIREAIQLFLTPGACCEKQTESTSSPEQAA